MRSKDLTAALAALKRVLADPRIGPVHKERLQKEQRALERFRRSGRIDQRQVFRVVSSIAEVLAEVISESQALSSATEPRNTVDKR